MTELLEPGLWGVLATPFNQDGTQVDVTGLEAQVELHRAVGATGVVALGVFGEAAKLSDDERRRVVRTVVDATDDDLEVIVGLSEHSTAPALAQADVVCEASPKRLAGLMVQVNTERPDALLAHLAAVGKATGLGLVVQDFPVASGVRVAPATLCEVVETLGAVAIKAESSPTPPAVAALARRTSIPIFGGLGGVNLVDELAAGAAGAMTGFSCPEGLVAALGAWADAGFDAACDAWAPWLPLATFEAQQGLAMVIRKRLMQERGLLAHATVREPGPRMPAHLESLLVQHLARVRDRLVVRF